MSEIKLKKKKKWPVIVAIVLLLISCVGVYGYRHGYLDPILKACRIKQEEEHIDETKEDVIDQNTDNLVDDITEETEDEILSNTEVTDESDNDTVKPERPDSGSSSGDTGSQKKGHWETRYETKPAWDEQVLVKEGWTEKILVKDAWDEEDTYCYAFGYDQVEVEVCNTCGARFHGGINQHLSETGHSGWHNEYENVGEQHCLEYRTEYIHHDAEYKYVYHEPEYRIVHHPEETISYKVWIED